MRLIRVALTGGIATGKSYVLAQFASRNVPTVDADTIAHEVTRAGQPATREIRQRFGSDMFGANGNIDRERLARHVFDDPRERRALEAIIHPRVRLAIDQWFAKVAADGQAAFAIADIPLLFETGRQYEFDRIVVTVCNSELQLERLMTRDRISDKDARRRIASQLSLPKKVAAADFTVNTEGRRQNTNRQVNEIYAVLRGGL